MSPHVLVALLLTLSPLQISYQVSHKDNKQSLLRVGTVYRQSEQLLRSGHAHDLHSRLAKMTFLVALLIRQRPNYLAKENVLKIKFNLLVEHISILHCVLLYYMQFSVVTDSKVLPISMNINKMMEVRIHLQFFILRTDFSLFQLIRKCPTRSSISFLSVNGFVKFL